MSTPFFEKILAFYQEDPTDPFNVYALALEYAKFDTSKAIPYYEELLTKHPAYLPTYYHAAQLYALLEMHEKASSTYQTGIALAQEVGQIKTLTELKRAYQTYLEEQEDW